MCVPRFDSPSVAALRDAERGGGFRIAPEDDGHVVRQLCLPDSAILVARFMSEFSPTRASQALDRSERRRIDWRDDD